MRRLCVANLGLGSSKSIQTKALASAGISPTRQRKGPLWANPDLRNVHMLGFRFGGAGTAVTPARIAVTNSTSQRICRIDRTAALPRNALRRKMCRP